jgi:O-acetyl-ADP-ribose deacetylase
VTEYRIAASRLLTKRGDLVLEDVDAIVNAANAGLRGGGGVDGAIHRAGGPSILEECRAIGGCRPGDAVITTGGRLAARHVIHAVGPIWAGGTAGEDETLASAYRRSLEIAAAHALRSLAFPSISTGAYGFPIARAAKIALATVHEHQARADHPIAEVRFVLFSDADLAVYAGTAATLLGVAS